MADRFEALGGDETPVLNDDTFRSDPHDDDALVMRAIAKVTTLHRCCVKMCNEEAPRGQPFAKVECQLRHALIDLAHVAAVTPAAYAAKLDTLTALIPWFGREDSVLFDCFVKLSQETIPLVLDLDDRKPVIPKPPRDGAGSGRVRWFLGFASAVPGLLHGRWDSGGVG